MFLRFGPLLVTTGLVLTGCNALVHRTGREPLAIGLSGAAEELHAGDSSGDSAASPKSTWISRQRAIFARAWQEMRRDMDYENIDAFDEMAPEARRDVQMMRDDLAGSSRVVNTMQRSAASDR